MNEKLKKAVGYLIVSILLFGNAFLLQGVSAILMGSYYTDMTLIVLLLFWVGIVWMLLGLGHILIEMFTIISSYVKGISK